MTKYETTPPPFHLGQLVREQAKSQRIGPTELGSIIHTSKQNVYGIFKRPSMNCDLIYKLSQALQYDFFALLSAELGLNETQQLERKVEQLEEEVTNLKVLVELLKKERERLQKAKLR